MQQTEHTCLKPKNNKEDSMNTMMIMRKGTDQLKKIVKLKQKVINVTYYHSAECTSKV